jgi:quinol-cytochrome oxidoreductase complex cytochrome b subunit
MTSSSPAPESPRLPGPQGGPGKSPLMRFLDERLGLAGLRALADHKQVPVHRHSFWYLWGGMVLFLFLLQVVTGILLLLYYRPGSAEAYESVQFIVTKVEWGWLVRSLHSISANLLMLAVLVHMASTFFLRAYRRPRELTWVTGVLLFFVFITFGFSGYLLPWNELAYFATAVGTAIPAAIPWVGDFMVTLVRGGSEVTGATLSRFFGLHVAILPAITTLILGAHLYLVQRHGTSVPRGAREKSRPMPFLPNFLLRDMIAWFVALGVLVSIIVLAPTAPMGALFPFDALFDPKHLLELGSKADPFASAPAGIKPEWYFLFMYQALKMLPAVVLGLEGEMLGVLAFGVGAAVLVLVPFLDRGASGLPSSRFSRAGGTLIVVTGLLMAALGTWSMHLLGSVTGMIGGVLAAAWIVASVVMDRRRPAGAPSLLFPSLGWLTVAFIVVMTAVGRMS